MRSEIPVDREGTISRHASGGDPRLFVAITLPGDVRERIGAAVPWPDSGSRALRYVPRHQYHLTLRFLGSTPRNRISELRAQLDDEIARVPRFDLEISGGGAFPGPGRPRVLWVGVTATPALLRARSAVEAAVAGSGLEREARPFSPHITVARVKRGERAPEGLGHAMRGFAIDIRVPVRSIALVRSTLSPGGARHDIVHRAGLAAAGD